MSNWNHTMTTEQKKALMGISKGSQKGREPKYFDPSTGTNTQKSPVQPSERDQYSNLPVRGSWTE